MTQRLNIHAKRQAAMRAIYGLAIYLSKSPVDVQLLELIYYRVSQITGCTYCLDMHSEDLLAKRETVQRLLVLVAWRETPFHSEKERAALAWAEALTKFDAGHVPDDMLRSGSG